MDCIGEQYAPLPLAEVPQAPYRGQPFTFHLVVGLYLICTLKICMSQTQVGPSFLEDQGVQRWGQAGNYVAYLKNGALDLVGRIHICVWVKEEDEN